MASLSVEELEADYEDRQRNGRATRSGPKRVSGWDAVETALRAHYHEPDVVAARVLYAAVAAHDLKGQPVWAMAVAPPSSLKTEIVRALDGLPGVHSIDGITPKTFISGQIRDRDTIGSDLPPSSLLHRIGGSGVIVCADFSTILAIKSDDRKAIMADLRRIYDGELRKEFGTSDVVPAWKGRITFVACVTPEIDKHHLAIQSLGDRFVMVRWGRAGQQAAIQAMMQDLDAARHELKSAVHALFKGLEKTEPEVPKDMFQRLSAMAEFAVRARSHVPRIPDGDKSIIGEPQAESAPRLAKQLCQLAKGSARLSRRDTVAPEDFAIAKRAAFDCIPDRRRKMLDWAIDGGRIDSNKSTKKYDREDLEALGLVEGDHLSQLAKRLLAEMDAPA